MQDVSVLWFRRDLRLEDNAGLYHALRSGYAVVPVFIFDINILDELEDKQDQRVSFIYDQLKNLQKKLVEYGSTLHVLVGEPITAFKNLSEQYNIKGVYTNRDYEPYATKRDGEIRELLECKGVSFNTFKDQVIFEKDDVTKGDGKPYTIFTPYSKKWKVKLASSFLKEFPSQDLMDRFLKQEAKDFPSIIDLGFERAPYNVSRPKLDVGIASTYDRTRDIPSLGGTTRLSVHLRFGTISIRRLVAEVLLLNQTLLNELIWREFYQMILWHFPHVVTSSFKPEYDKIEWRNDEIEFEKWCSGNTGYPIVDAGMRELNETGYMHNRARMIVASFLTKHLLIDWRWGEAYFAKKLIDYDLASNNGGWQWAAGSGCDAAPYFRIFNPYLQTKKFDHDLHYITKWVPELNEFNYPDPIVDHSFARERCLRVYKKALSNK